jgi:phosphatidylserine/phosphatidylglycerophosphate/cardiolipin synthase-like enzyme
MHAWYGGRGRVIATRLAALRANGCHVQVIPGITMGSQIRSTLRKAGVPLATIRHPARRTHQKVLQISGHYGSDTSARLVFTGSHNWSDRGLQCDDNILRIDSPTAYQRYAADFATIWRRG